MVDASHRANEVLEGVRGLFAKGEPHKAALKDVNGLIARSGAHPAAEFNSHKIEIRLTLNFALPPVSGHRGQLLEVMINLIHNALEAMASVDGRRVLQDQNSSDGGRCRDHRGGARDPASARKKPRRYLMHSFRQSRMERDWALRSAG